MRRWERFYATMEVPINQPIGINVTPGIARGDGPSAETQLAGGYLISRGGGGRLFRLVDYTLQFKHAEGLLPEDKFCDVLALAIKFKHAEQNT